MPVDLSQFKAGLASWASGVSVVTVKTPEGPNGMTVSAFNSVSAEPPIVLVCINRSAYCCPQIRDAEAFAVNILEAGQQQVSNLFASSKHMESRWDALTYAEGVTGAPLIDGSLACLDCKLVEAVDSGSHTVYFGLVEQVIAREGLPLLYYKGAYRGVQDL